MAKDISRVLHLSFDSQLPRVLVPRQPDDSTGKKGDNSFKEDLPKRVSFSPTVQQCFLAIYPNISHYFEKPSNKKKFYNYPYLDMFVYRGLLSDKTKVIGKEVLLEKIWDYEVTEEIAVTQPIEVELLAKIRIYNPYYGGQTPERIEHHPFGDEDSSLIFVGPVIRYKITNIYNRRITFE